MFFVNPFLYKRNFKHSATTHQAHLEASLHYRGDQFFNLETEMRYVLKKFFSIKYFKMILFLTEPNSGK